MNTAFFTNISSEICRRLDVANKEIRIAMAWFTNSTLFAKLIDCLKKGVRVELILLDDAINWQPYAPDFNNFISAGGCLRVANRSHGFMHHKFCIIDTNVIISGSYNWTYYAETRNLENVIISTDSNTIDSFAKEFSRLSSLFSVTKNTPRLEWRDIEQMANIDFDILNYEVESTARACNMPFHQVVKSNTTIQIVEKRNNPKAAYNIGIAASEGNEEKDILKSLISKGDNLPCTKSFTFYNYPDERNECRSIVAYGNLKYAEENNVLLNERIKTIMNNSNDDLQIFIQMTLNTNGYLHVEIRCLETGKAIELTTTNQDLVNYDE